MLCVDANLGHQYSTDFHRPLTSEAVRRLDGDCQLVYNRKYGLFQVVRWTGVVVTVNVPGLGRLSWIERVPFWECDVEPKHGVERNDYPDLLIQDMREGDTREKPELLDDNDRLARVVSYRQKMEEAVRGHWRHATRWNRRQVQRMWQPFKDYTGYVR